MSSELRQTIQADMKSAMRAKDQARLEAIRLLLAKLKQAEIDEKITIDDDAVMRILNKQVKMFRESITQYEQAGRDDLVAKEQAQLAALQVYLPTPLTETEIDALVAQALDATQAQEMKAMGQVMAWLKPHVEGRADMSLISQMLKARLS